MTQRLVSARGDGGDQAGGSSGWLQEDELCGRVYFSMVRWFQSCVERQARQLDQQQRDYGEEQPMVVEGGEEVPHRINPIETLVR